MNALHVKTTLYIQIDYISVMCILRLIFFFFKEIILVIKKDRKKYKNKSTFKNYWVKYHTFFI